MKKPSYSVTTYFPSPWKKILEKRRTELGYPDLNKYLRRLVFEGIQKDYFYEDPDVLTLTK